MHRKLRQLAQLEAQFALLDDELAAQAHAHPQIRLLMSLPQNEPYAMRSPKQSKPSTAASVSASQNKGAS